jgi:hypothetical protein
MNQITKFVDGELYCNVFECPQTKETLKFISYDKIDKSEYHDEKNYTIVYECKWCSKKWAKLMKSRDDPKPEWLPVIQPGSEWKYFDNW